MNNMFMHLTNVAIQKFSSSYSDHNGGKWPLKMLRFYLDMVCSGAGEKCFEDLNFIIVQALKAVQPVMISDKHCFELYGFDILLNRNCKLWLLEINASPSLSTTTAFDRTLKSKLLRDVYAIVVPQESLPAEENSFVLVYDEALQEKKTVAGMRKSASKAWK